MLRILTHLLILAVVLSIAAKVPAAEPLHIRIDKALEEARVGPPGARTSDAEFLRRVYLDLAGVIPSATEARKFLDDRSPDKRTRLIDRLLGSPQYVRHLTDTLNVMLMERRKSSSDWEAYLQSSVEQNKPWNQLAAEILGSDGVDPKLRAPINFYLARSVEANLMTRDVGRIFFGVDLQCAQCHNHPEIRDYLQADYYGIYAFVDGTYPFKQGKKKPTVLAEKPATPVKFKSVFTGEQGITRPRLPGSFQIDEPTFKKGEEYKVKPNKKKKYLRPVPKYSRRERLAELVAKGENLAFRRNIANRLWAHMMGRGLVHPPDLLHNDNPPSHPRLLDLLANEFATMKFDIKAFLRELALTKVYQRSVELPNNLPQHVKAMEARLAELQSIQKELKTQQAKAGKAVDKVYAERDPFLETRASLIQDLKKANATIAAARKAQPTLAKALAAAKKQLAARQAAAKPVAASVAKAQQALKKQPDNKGQAAVLAKLQKTLQQRNAEVARWNKIVTQKANAIKQNAAKLAGSQQAIPRITAQQAETHKQIDAVNRRLHAVQKQQSKAALAVKVGERRLATVQTFLDYVKQMQQFDALRGSAGSSKADLSTAEKALDETYGKLTTQWSEQFVIGTLEPQSPEQLAWSVMQATGYMDRQRNSSAAVINKKKPLKPSDQKDPAKVLARTREIEQDVYKRLERNVRTFVSLFGLGAGQPQYDFFASADQALFFANGSQLRSWLAPAGGNLTDRLLKMDQPEKLAEELYLSVLTRRPTAREVNDVKQYLAARPKEKNAVVQELAWALITSSEFRFNH